MPASHSRWRAAFRVGDWVVDPASGQITRGTEARRLPPLSMDLLVLLAFHAGNVVGKERILDEVWGGRFVSESALTRAMAELRRFLGDGRRPPLIIETVPKRGYRLIAAVTPPTRTGVPALAVLPFDTVAGSPVEGFLADGISDAITTELGKLAALRVISRQSTLRFKGARASLGDIARELQVDAVVEGLVQSDGTRLRLSAQLVEVDPERHLWAESYDCNVAEILAVQRKIARRAADAVHAALRPGQVRPTTEPTAILFEAHLSYLEGRHFLARWTREGVEKGIGCLLRAIQLDRQCAPAHEELAVALLLLAWLGHLPLPEAVSRARESARVALEIDDSCCRAHVALGCVAWLHDWDLTTCERELTRAVDANPNDELALMTQALFRVAAMRDVAGMADVLVQALAIDPLGFDTNFRAGWLWIFARDYASAERQARRTLDLHPRAAQPIFVLALARLGQGDPAGAAALLEPVVESGGNLLLSSLGNMYGRSGRTDDARRLLARFQGSDEPHAAIFTVAVAAGLGDFDLAFSALERACAERDSQVLWVPLVPVFDPLAGDPRLAAILARMAPAQPS